MKNVVLITNYFHFKSEKESNRYRELAYMIAKEKDINLEVITSKFYQRTKTFRANLDELKKEVPFKVSFVDEPGYKKNISLKRLRTSKVFGKNVIKYLKSIKKPDVIYQVVPTLDVANYVGKWANKNQIPFIIDVQDLWPEAYKMAINIPFISDILFYPILKKANAIYKRADAVCAVSKSYVNRVLSVNKKVHEGHPVYIGINLEKFDSNIKHEKVIKDSRIKLAYCGSLEKSYDIKLVIDALASLKNPPLFVVIGDGSMKKEFEEYAAQKKVDVIFTGYVQYSEMCDLLCSCDITVNPIIGESVATIINKHGDYCACGLPVLNTQKSEEYENLVDSYQMGFNCHSEKELSEKIQLLIDNPQLRKSMGVNARRCAEEKFDRNKTYTELVGCIKNFK